MNNKNQSDSVDELERAKFADSYIGRIRTFQNQLLIWGVSLNFVAGVYVVKSLVELQAKNYWQNTIVCLIISVVSFLLNWLIGCVYLREHNIKDGLVEIYEKYLDFKGDLKYILKEKEFGGTYKDLVSMYKGLRIFWIIIFLTGLVFIPIGRVLIKKFFM